MSHEVAASASSGIYWLASYPKSGNTWFRAFVSNLIANADAPVDINALNTDDIASSRGWLDDVLGFDTADMDDAEIERLRPAAYRWAASGTGVMHIKIHDAYTADVDGEPLISHEGTLGAVYIVRNPLDVALSAAAHWNTDIDGAIARMGREDASLARTERAPALQVRQRMLSWSKHVLSWVDAPRLRLLVLRYEDMLARPVESFRAAARFLGLPDETARVEKAVAFSDFKVLSSQEAARGFREQPTPGRRFFRQGTSGGWRGKLTDEQVARIVRDHEAVMSRFGYVDERGRPA